MKSGTTKKRLAIIVLSTTVSLAIGGIAFAYITSTGSGTGTATDNGSSTWVLTSSPVSGLGPGLAAQSIVGTATNSLGQTEYIGTVTPTVTSTSGGSGCTAADFTVTPGVINADTASGASGLNFGTIAFNDRNVNQNACEGVTVNLGFTSN